MAVFKTLNGEWGLPQGMPGGTPHGRLWNVSKTIIFLVKLPQCLMKKRLISHWLIIVNHTS